MEEATWEEELVFKGKFPTFSLASPCGKFIVEETKRRGRKEEGPAGQGVNGFGWDK